MIPHLSRFENIVSVVLFICCISGCAAVDAVDDRAETVNRTNSEYNNTATLLNIVRASLFETPSFVSVSSFQAHGGVAGTLGIPSASFGPSLALSTFATGSSSTTASDSADYAININDDKTFFGPLMVALSARTLNSYIRNQGYPRELLFYLAIDHIEIRYNSGVERYLANNPFDETSFRAFGGKLAELVNAGLTTITVQNIVDGKKATKVSDTAKGLRSAPSSSNDQPMQQAGASASGDKSATGVQERSTFCFDRSLPRPYPGSSEPEIYGPTCDSIRAKGVLNHKFDDGTFTVSASDGTHLHLELRSTFGIYEYLGRFVSRNSGIENVVATSDSNDSALITIVDGDSTGCFAKARYRGIMYCVPNSANNTKRVFTLLRQLNALNTAAAPPAVTTSVHLTTP